MKKITILVLPLFSLCLIALLSFSVYKKIKAKKTIENNIASLPWVTFSSLKNEAFSINEVSAAKTKLIINYFNPDCEHCQDMARSYLQNAFTLKKVKIIMITVADSIATSKFITIYKLDSLPNIIVLRDKNFQFEQVFGKSIIPSFFVYQNNKLLKKITGETKIENLLN